MIGSVSGIVIYQGEQYAVVETASGVGYRVFVGSPLSVGQSVQLFTFQQIREESDDLYGFSDPAELAFFELLLTVSGVGPKMALTLVKTLGRAHIAQAIVNNQPAVLKSVSGVGQKVAEKIIVELKNKLKTEAVIVLNNQESDELFEALVQFGYKQPEILTVLQHIPEDKSTGEKLKEALQRLGRK